MTVEKRHDGRCWLTTVCLLAAVFWLAAVTNSQASPELPGVDADGFVQGLVLAVQPVQLDADTQWEVYTVSLELLGGPEQGRQITLEHTLTGHAFYDIRPSPGDRVLLHVEDTAGVAEYAIADFARQRPLAWLAALFVVTMAAVGGRQGLRSLLSLAVLLVVAAFVLLPLVLRGYSPILVTVLVGSLLAVVMLALVAGFNRKSYAACVGTIGGLAAAGILAVLFGRAAHLTGLAADEAQMLQLFDQELGLQGLLFAGIMLGALGAILDVSISVASAMEQMVETAGDAARGELVRRGIAVGRDVLGTMANTLVLAYLGASLPLLLLFYAYDIPPLQVVNLELVAAELVRAMAGTIGLSLAVPLTAAAAGWLLVSGQRTP